MKNRFLLSTITAAALGAALPTLPARAQPAPASALQTLQVTATRFGEPVQQVPGAISVVTGDEIRARGATDLRSALALLSGVSVAPGGDAGPAGAAPSLLGVREVDDLLLLIDGIPAGGAFIPQVVAVSLVNVERIEVLRGGAPVYFGTTAFAGTINVIHYEAGRAEQLFSVSAGSRGSAAVSASTVLSTGDWRQSISGEISRDKSADPRASYNRAQGSWRLGTALAGGTATTDLNLLALRQKPDSPVALDDSTGRLTTVLPLDFNQNPADAKLDTDRTQLVIGHDTPLAVGRWASTLALTRTTTDSVRSFIDLGDTPQPWTAATNADVEAFRQHQRQRELFLDSHLTGEVLPRLDLTGGVNLLLGRASAHSSRHALKLLLNGVNQAPPIDSVAPKGTVDFDVDRRFVGLYAQGRYRLGDDLNLLAGLRWNSTRETRDETRVNSRGVVTVTHAAQDVDRLSGSLGGSWKAWQEPGDIVDSVTLHASVGNTFQPAQIDFGPNPETQPEGGGLLKPETQRSLVFGLKAELLDGFAEIDIDGFFVDFFNQPVETRSTAGTAVLRAAGQQRFKGLDVEGALRPGGGWTLKGNMGWSDARYRDFITEIDGVPMQLAGRRQILTPTWRAGTGLIYGEARGWTASLTAAWVGKHWLDAANTAEAPGYAVVDASLGYRFENCSLQLAGRNLGDRRDAAQRSELGDGQFYRLPARRFDLTLSFPLR